MRLSPTLSSGLCVYVERILRKMERGRVSPSGVIPRGLIKDHYEPGPGCKSKQSPGTLNIWNYRCLPYTSQVYATVKRCYLHLIYLKRTFLCLPFKYNILTDPVNGFINRNYSIHYIIFFVNHISIKTSIFTPRG